LFALTVLLHTYIICIATNLIYVVLHAAVSSVWVSEVSRSELWWINRKFYAKLLTPIMPPLAYQICIYTWLWLPRSSLSISDTGTSNTGKQLEGIPNEK